MNSTPPPVIDSAKLIAFASNDNDVEFTNKINLFVGKKDNLKPVGEVDKLAICANYADTNEVFLFFCDTQWEPKGVSVLTSVEEAKIKAERGYKGISGKWKSSPYSEKEVNNYLRNEYQVDPDSKWWIIICSFCGKNESEVDEMISSGKASICKACVEGFYEEFHGDKNA
jgi:hypothetical protein